MSFLATFCVLFAMTVAFMVYTDTVPEAGGGTPRGIETAPAGAPEAPVRVAAPDIGLDVEVLNPDSTDTEVLDAALLKGAVRYPTSALLGEQGTVLLFGHSSYLPIVHNQNYKAFNGIQNLRVGQQIVVRSAGRAYAYRVTGVRQVNLANADESVVELRTDGQYLVLVTCDSFATKSDRFVVTAVAE